MAYLMHRNDNKVKRCGYCKVTKNLDAFYQHGQTWNSRQSYCILCIKWNAQLIRGQELEFGGVFS